MKRARMANGYLLCEKIDEGDNKTASGIILSESKQDVSFYKVVSAPARVFCANTNEERPCIVDEGQTIMVVDQPIRSTMLEIGDKPKQKYHLFNEFQVVAIVF